LPWEKAHHQWGSAKAKPFTLCAGVAADGHTMCDRSVVEPAVLEKQQKFDGTIGEQRLFKDKESQQCANLFF
jgi:hypothetical protein